VRLEGNVIDWGRDVMIVVETVLLWRRRVGNVMDVNGAKAFGLLHFSVVLVKIASVSGCLRRLWGRK
jgi:hypothetical protein